MKVLLKSIFIFIILSSTYAQTLLEQGLEIATRTEGFNGTAKIKFTMSPLKQAFCINYDTYYIDDTSTANEEVEGNNSSSDYGFNVCYNSQGWEFFWLTYYQMTIYVDDEQAAYFYLDFRDCHYGMSGCSSNDISFKIKKVGDNYELYYAPGLTTNYTQFYEGNLINWWVVNGCSSHTIDCFINDPFDLDISAVNNHPYLAWEHNTDPNGTYYYEVWRLLTQYSSPIGTSTLINTVSNKYFTDYEVYIGNGSWGRAYYKIRAKIDDLYSAYSPYDYITFEGLQKDGSDENINKVSYEYRLFENYPNPFNPITKIIFAIPEPTFVQIRVFDPFGKEVAVLVNDRKAEGIYQTEFNAGNLSSGIYFYQLTAGKFIETKKMLLVK